MKKIALAISLLFGITTSLQAQKIVLDWRGTETIDYGIEKKNFPKFSNTGYSVENDNIYINIEGEHHDKIIRVQNLQWKKIDSQKLLDINDNQINEEDYTDVFYLNKGQNNKKYYAKIGVFKRKNNDIYQLQSFEITYDNTTANTAKNSYPQILSKNNTSPLSSGNIYKIKVNKSGVFKIDKKFLSANGIPIGNPKDLKIYGNGGVMLPEDNRDYRNTSPQQVAIQVVGEEDGVWNDGDYALFYAQGADGYNLYGKFGNGYKRRDNRTDRTAHLKNLYEDNAYYFITFDNPNTPAKRITDQTTPISGNLTFTRYDDYQYINNDKHNLMKLGRIWVDDHFNSQKAISFKLQSSILPTDKITFRTSVVGYNNQSNHYTVNINGTNERNIYPFSSSYNKRTYEGSVTDLSGNTLTVNITPNFRANPSGLFYLDYVEVQYKEDLKFNGSQMNFRSYDIAENSSTNYGFTLSNISELEQVWEVSDIITPKRKINVATDNTTFSFGYDANSDQFNNEFVAFKSSAAYTPEFVGKIENQNLYALQNVDYLIISPKNMMSQGERIAEYYRKNKNYNAQVVDIAQIYNEFSSGSQDITAIREFITLLKNEKGGLKYVLLMGDTSYDFKNRISGNENIIPSYQSEDSGSFSSSYVTDDYFVMTDVQASSNIVGNFPTIPIGRLLASNPTEAKILVDKTLAYYNALPNQSSPFGEWRMKLDFVVDDDNDGGKPFHTYMEEAIKENFEKGVRNEYNVKKLYLDSFEPITSSGGQRFPQINQANTNAFGNSLYLFYFGHGGINGWAQERVLVSDDIKNINNFSSVYSRFPFVSTITCEFTLWDDPKTFSVGEQVMKHPSGGAATMITSSRAIGVSYGESITGKFTKHIFDLNNQEFNTLGDAFLNTKIEQGYNSNHLKVNYLGDPAMALSRPKPQLVIDEIITPEAGKIRALDKVKIVGHITDASGNLDPNFSGRISFSIFDKRLNKTTRNNDGGLGNMSYTEEGSPILRTSGKVEQGKFATEFYIPKDINYTLGEGRILAYADNFTTQKQNAFDVFQNKPYTIGEINPNPDTDQSPPTVKLFMNNTNFADGGITNANPTLLACLTDDMGINATGTGIGHDITVVLDGEVVNTTVLNDFFIAGEGNGCINSALADYQKGSVNYPFKNLKPGPHQITFKVWDINNNSTTASLNFIVKEDADSKLQLNRLLNWPNPFTDKTYIQFEHNCDDVLDVNVQIFTLTGKLVKTISTSISAEPFREGYRTPKTAIEWDGRDDFGSTVGKGTYIYKVFAKSKNPNRCVGTATAIEKLVLLK